MTFRYALCDWSQIEFHNLELIYYSQVLNNLFLGLLKTTLQLIDALYLSQCQFIATTANIIKWQQWQL